MIEGWNWCQKETNLIYKIQFMVEGMFLIFPDFNIFTATCAWYTNLSLFDLILRWWHHDVGLKFQDFKKIVL